MKKKTTEQSAIFEIATKTENIILEVLRIIPDIKKKNLKIKLLFFIVPNEDQLGDIKTFFAHLLDFSDEIQLEIEEIRTIEQAYSHIELFKGIIKSDEFEGMNYLLNEGVLSFDVKSSDDSKLLLQKLKERTKLKESEYIINVNNEKSSTKETQKKAKTNKDDNHIYGRKRNYTEIEIKNIDEKSGSVKINGYVLSCELINLRSGSGILVLIALTDYTSSIGTKLFLKNGTNIHKFDEIQKGTLIEIEGTAQADKKNSELQINIESIYKKTQLKETDDAETKRVELHLHTKISTLDGVVDIKQLIQRVSTLGHRAVAITDHGTVQAFPEAAEIAKKYGVKILYGMECYLYDDINSIVTNVKKYGFDKPFVVFDIETTGLHANSDEILEIGAIKIQDGQVIDQYQSYVYTDHEITPEITKLTTIKRTTIQNAPNLNNVMKSFIKFCSDCAVAAHNSSFDMSFIQTACSRLEIDFNPPCVDTLALSRALLEKMKSYRLDSVCKKLNIKLDNHHTALADATATALLLKHLLNISQKNGFKDLSELNSALGHKAMGRNNTYHAVIFAKNQKGLKSLYEMVSISHKEYLFRGKPNIPKSILTNKREHIIVGSACASGELYAAILNDKTMKEIEQIAEYYDFLEIQPLGNNEFLIREGVVEDKTRLIQINKIILELGEKLNKPVVATGDVHFLYQRDEYIRRILMHGQNYEDAETQAPLYYRTTREMLDEYAYLDDKTAYEIVVTNTNLFCDMTEDIEPLPPYKLYAPHIDGAKESIIELSYEKAHEIYGDNLPEPVQKRLKKELDSITGHGYSVLYLIAHKLVKKSNEDGYLVGSRGSVGSSFVAHMTGITEVNPLPSHYTCSKCKFSDFEINTHLYSCGPDMPNMDCPVCGNKLCKRGFDIPFEVFLGFKGDKVPDIDLNFSGDYQSVAHKYTEDLLGKDNVFRAGTLSSIAERTAFGFVKRYLDEKGLSTPRAEIKRLVDGLSGVKKTTGQHPGGIIVVPSDMDIHDFTPTQFPADDIESGVITTHFDFNSMHDRLVKLDILGHDDPTMLKMLHVLTGVDPVSIPLDDPDTLSLFSSTEALGISPEDIGSLSGTFGIPEFGTRFVREMLKDTKPTTFAELIRISGLSHGTDVWLGNARDLILSGKATLLEAICTRDDIMNALIDAGVDPKISFEIMENVRKGKGLTEDMENAMKEKKVTEWFINSCKLIKYMFPKAHAVAYVTMGFRVAYYKVNFPKEYYTTYFTVRADDFDAKIMLKSKKEIKKEIIKLESENTNNGDNLSSKDKRILTILEMILEMKCRGIDFVPVNIYTSHATEFKIVDEGILPPLISMPGLGINAAQQVVEARKDGEFATVEQLKKRAKLNKSVIELLREQGAIDELPESDQVTIFDMI